jgi:NitT/TauT family transport system ATP-binding protein
VATDASSASMPGAAMLQMRQVGMGYGQSPSPAQYILADLNLDVAAGEFFVLVGPSGSGKSTLLKLIAGTAFPNTGSVTFEGQAIEGPDRRRGMVFQSVEGPLFDWLTVEQNIGFGLMIAKTSRAQYKETVARYLDLVGLTGHEQKYPHELSGGMKQRVQIARTLAVEPDLVLMDEPFAALDALTRRVLQREIARIWSETRKTVVYVTHDIREALLLGQRIGVMSIGPRATVRKIHHIDLPFSRNELAPEFLRLNQLLDEEIEQEATRQWAPR